MFAKAGKMSWKFWFMILLLPFMCCGIYAKYKKDKRENNSGGLGLEINGDLMFSVL